MVTVTGSTRYPARTARRLILSATVVAVLLAGAVHASAPATTQHTAAATRQREAPAAYAGWAMDAFPGDSVGTLTAEMGKQVRAGANAIWLGHNNPGEVDAAKHEPGLSYAVWAAYRDPANPKHTDAMAMVEAQQHALTAAKGLGVRVVLPVGYQIQMGATWNAAHPQEMRRNADGHFYVHGQRSAAFDSPDYQRGILAYYHWVDATFVRPYTGTVTMLNIADEPADGDYSVWADRVFRAGHGYGLLEAGTDPARQRAVGRFQATYIARYAAWSAQQWLAIDPAIKVTLSFCGGYGRTQHEGPDLEAVFRDTPSNFVVTFDAYPRDGLYDTPLRQQDLVALFALIRSLGYYSHVYGKPLWLWSTGNSWGLNGSSPDPGGIADAVTNGIYLAQLVKQVGGTLQGIAVWNYNIPTQGLYNDTHHLLYNPDQMFARVSASFPLLTRIMAAPPGQPDAVVLAPDDSALRLAGAGLLQRAIDGYEWSSLAALAQSDVPAPVLTHLDGAQLPALRTAIVLARNASDLDAADRQALHALLAGGGTVVASRAVAATLAEGSRQRTRAAGGVPLLTVRQVQLPTGTLLSIQGGPVESLFAAHNLAWAEALWRQVLHRTIQPDGYQVSGGGVTLLYSGPVSAVAMMRLPTSAAASTTLRVYDANGSLLPAEAGRGAGGALLLPRRNYALLTQG